MDKRSLYLLRKIGFPLTVPDHPPPPGHSLARTLCPLHDSDTPGVFALYADGFHCWSGNCHEDTRFGSNLLGLIRHLVYRVTGKILQWNEARRYMETHVPEFKVIIDAMVGKDLMCPGRATSKEPRRSGFSLADLLSCLHIPDPFYISRGFQPVTLSHFIVGRCVRPLPDGRNIAGWSVFPILDANSKFIGYSARNPNWVKGDNYPKWLHSESLPRGANLYNLSSAQRAPGPLIISEGPGDVIRFHEAGYPGAVATCGGGMTDGQRQLFILLDDCRRKLVVAGDNDERGRLFAAATLAKLQSLRDAKFAPVLVFPEVAKDFGDTPCEVIRRQMESLGFNATV